MIWFLLVTTIAFMTLSAYMIESRKRYMDALTEATQTILDLRAQMRSMEPRRIPLTHGGRKADDAPKRFTGPQLRRMAESENRTAPILTNSEILAKGNVPVGVEVIQERSVGNYG